MHFVLKGAICLYLVVFAFVQHTSLNAFSLENVHCLLNIMATYTLSCLVLQMFLLHLQSELL